MGVKVEVPDIDTITTSGECVVVNVAPADILITWACVTQVSERLKVSPTAFALCVAVTY